MNFKLQPLSELPVGGKGIVTEVNAKMAEKTRLTDLGFTPDAEVKALFKSPSGDPTAYEIMGTVLALRKEDAGKIIVRNGR